MASHRLGTSSQFIAYGSRQITNLMGDVQKRLRKKTGTVKGTSWIGSCSFVTAPILLFDDVANLYVVLISASGSILQFIWEIYTIYETTGDTERICVAVTVLFLGWIIAWVKYLRDRAR